MSENSEKEFGPQPPTTEQVVEVLLRCGKSSAESKEIIGRWIDNRQIEANKSPSPYSRIYFNIDLAWLLIEAKIITYAVEYYLGAVEMFQQQQLQDDGEDESREARDTKESLILLRDKIKNTLNQN